MLADLPVTAALSGNQQWNHCALFPMTVCIQTAAADTETSVQIDTDSVHCCNF